MASNPYSPNSRKDGCALDENEIENQEHNFGRLCYNVETKYWDKIRTTRTALEKALIVSAEDAYEDVEALSKEKDPKSSIKRSNSLAIVKGLLGIIPKVKAGMSSAGPTIETEIDVAGTARSVIDAYNERKKYEDREKISRIGTNYQGNYLSKSLFAPISEFANYLTKSFSHQIARLTEKGIQQFIKGVSKRIDSRLKEKRYPNMEVKDIYMRALFDAKDETTKLETIKYDGKELEWTLHELITKVGLIVPTKNNIFNSNSKIGNNFKKRMDSLRNSWAEKELEITERYEREEAVCKWGEHKLCSIKYKYELNREKKKYMEKANRLQEEYEESKRMASELQRKYNEYKESEKIMKKLKKKYDEIEEELKYNIRIIRRSKKLEDEKNKLFIVRDKYKIDHENSKKKTKELKEEYEDYEEIVSKKKKKKDDEMKEELKKRDDELKKLRDAMVTLKIDYEKSEKETDEAKIEYFLGKKPKKDYDDDREKADEKKGRYETLRKEIER